MAQFFESIDLHLEAFQFKRTTFKFFDNFTGGFHGHGGEDDASPDGKQRFTPIENVMHISRRPTNDNHIQFFRQRIHGLWRCASNGMDVVTAELFCISGYQFDAFQISFNGVHISFCRTKSGFNGK